MKIEDKLRTIIDYAVKNGWDICGFLTPANCETYQIHQWQNVVDLEIYYQGHKRIIQLDTIIFDHEFAKAFFGTYSTFEDGSGAETGYESWELGLQKLARLKTDRRLDYLLNYIK